MATFNTWGLPAPIAPNRKGRLGSLRQFAERLGADLVGLQEVWKGARPLVDLPNLLLAPLTRGDTGLAISSRVPTRDERVHHFATARGVDRFKKKGVLQAEVDVGDRQLPVLVTHLQAGESERAATVRSAQIDEVIALAGDGPALLLGDLNLYDALDAEAITKLEAAGFVDAAEGAGDHTPTYPGGTERLDRVMVRSGKELCFAPRAARVIANDLSDHHAVVVDLQVAL